MSSKHPNGNDSGFSSVWSSPNINQMTEMSQEWYKKMMNDSSDLLKISLENQNHFQLDFSDFITHSQPAPLLQSNFSETSQQTIDTFLFNSLPNEDDLHEIRAELPAIFTPAQSNSTTKGSSPKKPISSRGRRYQESNLLAQYCQEVLCKTAHPNLAQIDEIVYKLNKFEIPSPSEGKKLKSSIREWFRKRREYMATKIYRSCQRLLPKHPTDNEDMDKFLKKIYKNSALVGIIMLESKLPMEEEKEKLAFVKEKISDYYLNYPQRRIRNTTGFKNHIINKPGYDDEEEEDLNEEEYINLSQEDIDLLLQKCK